MPALTPGVLARGPWSPDQIAVSWRDDVYEPAGAVAAEADRAIAALEQRGSPSHDGLAARLAGWREHDAGLELDLQPMRWALRLGSDAAGAMTVLCIIRSHDGRWLAGRRADWVATWAGRWALGAGGSVELGEDPVEALVREATEEWSVDPERLGLEALTRLPNGMAMLIGEAWLSAGATVTPDSEHDEHAWWPAEVDSWPVEADDALRRVGRLLAGG